MLKCWIKYWSRLIFTCVTLAASFGMVSERAAAQMPHGAAYGWGSNSFGELISGSSAPVYAPTAVAKFHGNRSGASVWLVSSFSTASNIAAATLVRVWSFIHPGELGADFVNRRIGVRHSECGVYWAYTHPQRVERRCQSQTGFSNRTSTTGPALST